MYSVLSRVLNVALTNQNMISEEDATHVRTWWLSLANRTTDAKKILSVAHLLEDQEERTIAACRKGFLQRETLNLLIEETILPRWKQGLPKLVQIADQMLPRAHVVPRFNKFDEIEKAVKQMQEGLALKPEDELSKTLPTKLTKPKPSASRQPQNPLPGDNTPPGQSIDPENTLDLGSMEFFPKNPNGIGPASTIGVSTPNAIQRSPYDLLGPGTKLGRCVLAELLGEGANGKVYRAVHQTLNISVAIKVLKQNDQNEIHAKMLQRFQREAQSLARLNHPNILRILDFDMKPLPHLVLEYVEGWSLTELIQQSGSLRFDRALQIALDAANGLNAAKNMGIVHRDIKPANMLLSRDGKLKLADFGLALKVDADQDSYKEPIGTVSYISPEQIQSPNKVDHRSDMYSLGASLYHAVTGRVPFITKNPFEGMMMHLQAAPVPPHEIAPQVPIAVSDDQPAWPDDEYAFRFDGRNECYERSDRSWIGSEET
jgi:tRNA A-37 threonylcarbamoyl transferase component Bud32